MIKIVSRYDSSKVLWEGSAETVRDAVIKAIKEGADLSRANLYGANLSRADLSDANLSDANLSGTREDFYSILSVTKSEVPGLYMALLDGKINGNTYEGKCACLVGTIAKVKQCYYQDIPGLAPDSNRPAERLFLAIQPGNTPENNQVSAVVRDWITEFAKTEEIALPTRKIILE